MSYGKLFQTESVRSAQNLTLAVQLECGLSISGFVQTVTDCFPGLSRTCKDEIPGFSRTHKTRFQELSRINSLHKQGCIRSKKCTYRISYRCNCITVNKSKCNICCITVFLKGNKLHTAFYNEFPFSRTFQGLYEPWYFVGMSSCNTELKKVRRAKVDTAKYYLVAPN